VHTRAAVLPEGPPGRPRLCKKVRSAAGCKIVTTVSNFLWGGYPAGPGCLASFSPQQTSSAAIHACTFRRRTKIAPARLYLVV
jgi:hypothetical protein